MFAEQMRKYRTDKGLTQQMLADMLNVSVSAIQKWERGQAEPNARTLQKLADIFGVSMDELCDRIPPETNISVMTRAFRQMSPEEQQKLIAVGRSLFQHAFQEDEA